MPSAQKVKPGQPWAPSAAAHNSFVDAAEYVQRLQSSTSRTPLRDNWQATILQVKNTTAYDLDRFSVLGVDTVFPLPSANLDAFKAGPIIKGVTPAAGTHEGKFVVFLEPAKAGKIATACVAGVCVARIDVSDENHDHADIKDGDRGALESGTDGAALILWKESGTGVRRALIRFGNLSHRTELVQIQPDTGKRYATVNASGVFDGKVVHLDPKQGGDLREGLLEVKEDCWILPLRHRPEALVKVTYSGKVGTFTPGEYVTQEVTGASGWLFEDDGTDLYIHLEEGSADFEAEGTPGDRTITGATSGATAESTTATVVTGTLDEEKVNLLPAWDPYKGKLLGLLDVSGDERPLYAIDEAPPIRQFEVVDDDFLQNGDETWPVRFKAEFLDEPGSPPVWIYLPGEWETENVSAYYPGIGRKGAVGHKGSFGFAKWSEVRKRWEYIEGCFKIFGVGKTKADVVAGDRVTVDLWWKVFGGSFSGVEDSGCDIEAFNWYYEKIESGDRVVVAYDRQENLWYIVDVEAPVMIEGTDSGLFEPVGKIKLEDANPYNFTYNYPITFQKDATNHVVIVGVTGPDALTVKETDDSPIVQRVSVLQFDSGDFTVTDNGGGTVTVSLADEVNFGGGDQLSIGWDGSDGAFTLTSGSFYFSGGTFGIYTNAPYEDFHLADGVAALQNSTLDATSSIPAITVASLDGELRGYSDSKASDAGFLRLSAGGGTNLASRSCIDIFGFSTVSADSKAIRFVTAGTERLRINKDGHLWIPANSKELQFGATSGGDGQISHDGSDFVFNVDTGDFTFTGGYLGVGVAPTTPLHASQASTTAAIPVQTLEQKDVDEPFLKVIGTAAAADLSRSIVDNGDVTTATLAGWVKIEVQDDGDQITDQDYFLPVYTLA